MSLTSKRRRQTDLTAAHGAGESSGGVQELVSDVSEDGTYVYFVAKGVLANGGVSGEDNLYLLHDTGEWLDDTYIATLSAEDSRAGMQKYWRWVPVLAEGQFARVAGRALSGVYV